MADEPKVLAYRLRKRYWDGQRIHAAGSVLKFAEGSAPKDAKVVESTPAPEKPLAAKGKGSDPAAK